MTKSDMAGRRRGPGRGKGGGAWLGILAGTAAWFAGGAAGNDGVSRLEMRDGAPEVVFESGTDSFHRVFTAGGLAGEGVWRLTNVLGGVEGWLSWTDAVPGRTGFYAVERRGWEALVDSDGDGMADGWELRNRDGGFHPLDPSDGDADWDGDGATNAEEYRRDTLLNVPDTDGDGMPDGWEIRNGTDPLWPDADRDPDRDGLANAGEYDWQTDPLAPDTDGDGMPDGWEDRNQLNPLDPTDGDPDDDGDGLTNAEECAWGTDPRNDDCDGDGLKDGEERDAETDPRNADTDSDGLPDGWEVDNGLEPRSDRRLADYGLVARWTFDEGRGSIASNRACGAWNGVLKGMSPVNWKRDGRGGGALWFNGDRQYVSVSETNGDGRVLADGGPFTVAWVCRFDPAGAPAHAALGGAMRMPDSVYKGWMVRFEREGASLWWGMGDGEGGSKQALLAEAGELAADWTDVALTWDGTKARGYVDGKLSGGGEMDAAFADAGLGEIKIGACALNETASYWKGWIDDVQIYRRALSAEELRQVNDWLGDLDGDGLANGREYRLGTKADAKDSDHDGLDDGEELERGTDPLEADTDGDGMPDGWEVAHGFRPLDGTDGMEDPDGDGLPNAEECGRETDPRNPDTDGDGLPDGWEIRNGLDPKLADTDGDGLPDKWETDHQLDPRRPDADGDADSDGLDNREEFHLGTDPRERDTDGDGLDDRWERDNALDPLRQDTDGDGLPDKWEWENHLDPRSDGGADCGLVAWWKLDGNLLNAADTNKWAARLTPDGEPDWMQGRGKGMALRLDGRKRILRVAETDGAVLADGEPFTVAWVCRYGAEGAPSHAALGGEMAAGKGWRVQFEGAGTLYGTVGNGVGAPKQTRLAEAGELSDWTDVALAWDGTNLVGYLNGKVSAGGAMKVGFADAGRGEIMIGGCLMYETNSYWKGGIDDVRIYRRALSPEELRLANDWLRDPDGDGLPNGQEWLRDTDPWNPDCDDDTLPDGWEVDHGLDPKLEDSDDDGMPDGWEVENGLEPLVADADGDPDHDGLPNGQECAWKTDPHRPDWDGDGLPDGWEVEHGLNPKLADSDGDGMPDAWEVLYEALDPAEDDAEADPDRDGLPNVLEWAWKTEPDNPDTDDDGLSDGWEVENGLDPKLADSDGDGLPDKWEWDNDLEPRSDGGTNYGLVAWWKLDGNLLNSADTNKWAAKTRETAAPIWGEGRGAGRALRFTGAGMHLYVPETDGGERVLADGEPFTVTWVCRHDPEAPLAHAALGGEMRLDKGWMVRFEGAGRPLCWSVVAGVSNLARETLAGASVLTNWTDVALVWDGTNACGYVNGKPAGGGPQAAGFADAGLRELKIGACALNETWSYWKGWIDDVRIYRRALSAEELGLVNDWLGDADGDGLPNGEELKAQTDPRNPDCDGDTLPDGWEVDHGLDPKLQDSDGDGMRDDWEVAHHLRPLADDAGEDPDLDGLSNGEECARQTDPWNPDSDDDGLPDGDEVETGTNPLEADTDGDGMPDGWEVEHGLKPLLAEDGLEDPDGDGLTNLEEFKLGTNPGSADTDGDGLDDKWETDNGLDPLDKDTDGDGLPDGWERENELNPLSDGGTNYGLVAWWKMGGDLLNAADADKWAGQMTGGGEPVWDKGRGAGRALWLDGFRQIVRVSETNGEGAVLADGEPFTVAWVCKHDAKAPLSHAALGGETAAGKGWMVRFEGTGRPLYGTVGKGPGATKQTRLADAGELSDWTDVALAWDGTNVVGYVDGKMSVGGAMKVGFADAGRGEIMLGGCSDNEPSSYWRGWIDDVRVFRRALSAEELGLVNDWLGDLDRDGLPNGREWLRGTKANVADTDDDGLDDGDELNRGTDPLEADTDGDGMPDGWEVANGLEPLVPDADGDADGDGLPNGQEFDRETDPRNPDTDGDGLPDGWEAANGLDSKLKDTDGDGMPDGWEVAHGLDCLADDSGEDPDGDDSPNAEECRLGTDPHVPDSDGDGLRDGAETEEGTDPLVPDSDGDGLPDGWEVAYGLSPRSDGGTDCGLVAWWKMDGDLLNAADTNRWPGLMTGGGEPVWEKGRGAGRALWMDGTHQIVRVSETNGDGTVLLDGRPFTVTWVCKHVAEGAPSLSALGGEMAAPNYFHKGWMVRFGGTGTNRHLKANVGNGNSGLGAVVLTNPAGMSDWTDVALTWDGQQVAGYVNAKAVPDGKRFAHYPNAALGEIMIGGCALNEELSYWKGWIDDVRIYRRALSAEELARVNDWLGDLDGDGLANGREYDLGSDPTNKHSDSDGLEDGLEDGLGLDPTEEDSDGDGMDDGWEVAHGLAGLADDSGGDPDGDGLTNLEEYEYDTRMDPRNPDTDGDGLPDGAEMDAHTDPLEPDTDGDGMPDGWEVRYGLNPLADDAGEDADEDGLPNGLECALGTNPRSKDTDQDGIEDRAEHGELGTDPLDPDTDADGLGDAWEAANGTDPRSGLHGDMLPLVWLTFDEGEPSADAALFVTNRADGRFAATLQGPHNARRVEGVRGGALWLDGSNTCVLVEQPEPGSLLGTDGYTVSMWIRAEAAGTTYPTVFCNRRAEQQAGAAVWESTAEDTLELVEEFPGTGEKRAKVKMWGGRWRNRWTHLAVVHDGTVLRIYLDGSLRGEVEGPPTASDNRELYLGSRHGADSRNSRWKGAMDDVRIFGRALSREEIATLVEAESDGDLTGRSNREKASAPIPIPLEAGIEPDTEGSLDMAVRLDGGTPEGVHWLARYDGANPGSEAEVYLDGDDLVFELHDADGRPHAIRAVGVTSNGYLTAGTNRVTASWRGFGGEAHAADMRLYLNGVDPASDGIWQNGSKNPKLTGNAWRRGVGYQDAAWTEGEWGERDGSGLAWFGRPHGDVPAETGAVEVVEGNWHETAYGIPGRPAVPGGEAEGKSPHALRAEGRDPRVLVQDMMRPGSPMDYVDDGDIVTQLKRYRQFADSVEYAPWWMRGENPRDWWGKESESLAAVLQNGPPNGVGIAMSGHSMWQKMVCISDGTFRAGEFVRIATNGTDLVLSLAPKMVQTSGGKDLAAWVDKADRGELAAYLDRWALALSEYPGYEHYFLNETALTGIDERPWDVATYSAAGLEWFREYTAGKYGEDYGNIKFPLPALPSMLAAGWTGLAVRVEGELADRAEPTRDPDVWAKWWEWREVVFATEIAGYASKLAELNATNANWRGSVLFVSPILAFCRKSGLNMEQLAKVKGLDWLVMENTRLYGYGGSAADLREEVRLQLEAGKAASDRGAAGFGSYVMVHAYLYPDVANGVTTAVYKAEWVADDVEWAAAFGSKIVVPYSAAMLMDRPDFTASWQNTHYLPVAEEQWLQLRYAKLRSPPNGLSVTNLTQDVQLSWASSEGAEEYEVQLSRNGDFTDILAEGKAVEGKTYFLVSKELVSKENLPEQTFFWRVRAVYMKHSYTDDGEERGIPVRYFGNWSGTASFTGAGKHAATRGPDGENGDGFPDAEVPR